MKKKSHLIPIILIELYLCITVVCFAFGPLKYPVISPVKFYSFIFFYQIALLVGYIVALKKHKLNKKNYNTNDFFLRLVKILLILNILFLLFLMTRDFLLGSFSLSGILARIKLGLSNPGAAYNLRFTGATDSMFLGKIGSVIVILLHPIFYLVIPTGLILFRKLPGYLKIVLFVNIVLEIARSIGIGVNKGVFDVIVMIMCAIVINFLVSFNGKFDKQIISKVMLAVISLCVLILFVFNKNISSRGIGEQVKTEQIHTVGLDTIVYDKDCLLYKFVPDSLENFSTLAIGYLTQGYYGFSLTMDEDFLPLYGIGNSRFVRRYVDGYIFDSSQLTFEYRIQPKNWDSYVNWHSLYTSLADDFGLIGTIMPMFVIGYLFAVFFMESLNENIIAQLLLCLTMIMVLFIPMNNQIFAFHPTIFSYGLLSISYLVFKK